MYSISKTLLGGTVARITLAPETRLCGKSLERLSPDPSLKMLRSNLVLTFSVSTRGKDMWWKGAPLLSRIRPGEMPGAVLDTTQLQATDMVCRFEWR